MFIQMKMNMTTKKVNKMQYSQEVIELFQHPKNMKEIKDADGVGKVGNPTCGDLMWIYIKVGINKEGKK